MLQDIGRTIEASAVPVHIWKVKSHIGIVGNETADKTAVANGTLYAYEKSEDNNDQFDASSHSTDEEERQRTHGSQHQGLHDDWWHYYYEHSNDREDQYRPGSTIKASCCHSTKKGMYRAGRTNHRVHRLHP
jgi:hypothetical protein